MKTKSLINIFILAIVFTCGAGLGRAATFTVTKSTNSNDGVCDADCSLREAITAADSGDTVLFNSNLVGQTFTLGGSEIVITRRIIMDGNIDGTNVAFVSGSGTSRVFSIAVGGGLDLRNMIIVQGNAAGAVSNGIGGAIYTRGVLSLDRVSIRGNTAPDSAGAIYVDNTNFHAVNSSISGNQATNCSAFSVDNGNVDIANVTITNNRDPNIGDGAILGPVCLRNSTTDIRNATIANNISDNGTLVVISTADVNLPSTLSIGNTIVAANNMQSGGDVTRIVSSFNTVTSLGGNLIGSTANLPGNAFSNTNDTLGENPLLAPTNSGQGGHPVDTHPLQAGSPARNLGVDAVAVDPLTNAPLTTDARGATFPRISDGQVDKGAYEDQTGGSQLIVTKLTDGNDNVCDLDCSLREAVHAASLDAGTDDIKMAANVFGTMDTGATEITIFNHDVNIIGYPSLDADTLIISGNNSHRIFSIRNFANVSFRGLTMANGNGVGSFNSGQGGAIFATDVNLTLDGVVMRNNTGTRYGALYLINGNTATIVNSTISNNTTSEACSALGVAGDGGVIRMANTTVVNNSTGGVEALGAVCGGSAGDLQIRNSTIAFNRAANGPGGGISAASDLIIGNSIVAGNIAASSPDVYIHGFGSVTSVGGNLVQNTQGFPMGTFNQAADQTGADPMLMSLADNGGAVQTCALSASSPAINAGIAANAIIPVLNTPLTTDARGTGFPRIVGLVDKGAFETLVPTAAGVTVSGRVFTSERRGLRNAVVILTDNHGNQRMTTTGVNGTYVFEEVEAGQSYVISIQSKRYTFEPRVLFVTDELTDVDFTGLE